MPDVLDKIKNQRDVVQRLQDSLFMVSGPSVEELLKMPEFLDVAKYLESKNISLGDKKAIDRALREYRSTMENLPRLRVEVARKDINLEKIYQKELRL